MALKLEPIHSHGEPDLDGDMEIKHDDDAHVDPFNMVYSWTLDIPVSLAARGLFVYLMDWAGNKKKTWHRRKRMAAAVGVSPRTLHKYLHELEDQGLIWFEHRKAEGKPSMCHISGKTRVVQRQQILSLSTNKDPMQNLQEVAPVAKSARPPRKDCKTLSQNLQQNKDRRSNHTNKTDEQGVVAAPPPRAASASTIVSTEHDHEASNGRVLALALAREVFGSKTSTDKTLARYEAFMLSLLDRGHDWDDLWTWMFWMDSGRRYWRGKSRIFCEEQMLKDLTDWEASGKPEPIPDSALVPYYHGRRIDTASVASREAAGTAHEIEWRVR